MTGDPKRQAFFGLDPFTVKRRTYSFDSFVFPSCRECNTAFSGLECRAKSVLTAILRDEPLSADDWNAFLDWLDKVRVGLWLAYFYLNKNVGLIDPHFHITTRIGTRDRFVIVYKSDYGKRGVGFVGADTPNFQYSPSCFTLTVNNHVFFNASTFLLVSRRLGYPYARSMDHAPDLARVMADMGEGEERLRHPVVRTSFPTGGSFLCQAIFSEQMQDPKTRGLYETEYVQKHSLAWAQGRGAVFQEVHRRVVVYPATPTNQWLPATVRSLTPLVAELHHKTLDVQLELFQHHASTGKLDAEGRQRVKDAVRRMKKFSSLFKSWSSEDLPR
jgi:hypothetical protein